MSAINYFLKRGDTPMNKTTLIHGVNTISVWTPVAGKRVTVTNASISSNIGGTIAFYFDNTTSQKIAEFMVGASATVSPLIGQWESTTTAGRIFARVGASATDGWSVNLTGFEFESSQI